MRTSGLLKTWWKLIFLRYYCKSWIKTLSRIPFKQTAAKSLMSSSCLVSLVSEKANPSALPGVTRASHIPTAGPIKPGRDRGRRAKRWTVKEAPKPPATEGHLPCWLAPLLSLLSPPLPPVWGGLICHNLLLPVNHSWHCASSSTVKLDQFSSPLSFSLRWPSGNLVI